MQYFKMLQIKKLNTFRSILDDKSIMKSINEKNFNALKKHKNV